MALHADAHSGSWVECRGSIHTAFHKGAQNASITLLPKLLERIPVLIFAGDQDLICNYVGLEFMIKEMNWNGGTGLGVGYIIKFSVVFWLTELYRPLKRNPGVSMLHPRVLGCRQGI